MPRQRRTYPRRESQAFPDDFPQSLVRFKDASGLTWRELSHRIGTNPLTLRRWCAGGRPNSQNLLALLNLAHELSLSHLLPFPEMSSDEG